MKIEVYTISNATLKFSEKKGICSLCLRLMNDSGKFFEEKIDFNVGDLERIVKVFNVETLDEIERRKTIILRRKEDIVAIGSANNPKNIWYYCPERIVISLSTILKKEQAH